MHELMFQAGVKGMSERSELIPCNIYIYYIQGMSSLRSLIPFTLPSTHASIALFSSINFG